MQEHAPSRTRLRRRGRGKDPHLEEQLVRCGLPLVESVAHRFWQRLGGKFDRDELGSLGRAALVLIVRDYDPDIAPFVPYAAPRIRWAMVDAVRRDTHGRSWASRLGRGHGASDRDSSRRRHHARTAHRRAGGQGLAEPSSRSNAPQCALVCAAGALTAVPDGLDSPEALLIRKAEAAHLRSVVAKLPERERAIVQAHYYRGHAIDHIASSMGISRSWASRLHTRAIGRLRRSLLAAGRPRHGPAGGARRARPRRTAAELAG